MAEPEHVETILVTPAFRLLRITSMGHASPPGFWYDQDEHEWVTLTRGRTELEFDDGERLALSVGDACFIRARRRHRVVSTSGDEPTVWLALFFRADPLADLSPAHVARIVGHMNADHADAILDYARHLADVPAASEARMTDVDAAGFGVAAQTPEGERQLRLAFDAPLAEAGEARDALVTLAKRARR